MVVETSRVVPEHEPMEYYVNRMVKVLEKQGQIEPLQVKLDSDGNYVTFSQDAWGAEIVGAARKLGWPTLLIHVTNRYEE